jgi:hypothetical protein
VQTSNESSRVGEQFLVSSAVFEDNEDQELWVEDLSFTTVSKVCAGKVFHTSCKKKYLQRSPASTLLEELLLDSQATCDVVSNPDYLTNI